MITIPYFKLFHISSLINIIAKALHGNIIKTDTPINGINLSKVTQVHAPTLLIFYKTAKNTH